MRKGSTKPRLQIDKAEVEKWARAGATILEISQRLGVSDRTLYRRLQTKEWQDVQTKAQAELKISLRTKQVQLALAGNVTMLIWLGKQMLGQTDKLEHNGDANQREPIVQIQFVSTNDPIRGAATIPVQPVEVQDSLRGPRGSEILGLRDGAAADGHSAPDADTLHARNSELH